MAPSARNMTASPTFEMDWIYHYIQVRVEYGELYIFTSVCDSTSVQRLYISLNGKTNHLFSIAQCLQYC